jgi:VWFA-related protein
MLRRLLIAVILSALIASASGQDQVLRTQTTVVLAPTLVKNSKGQLVYGLHASDFVIEDDKVAQAVQLDETNDFAPVSVVVAVQCGGSAFHEMERMRGLGAMLTPVIDQGSSQIAIVEFDSKVRLAHDFTTDGDIIRNELKRLKPGDGGAAILDAINYSVNLLNKMPENHVRVLLLISETRDHGSSLGMANVATTIATSNTVLYALAFSPALSQVLDDVRGNNEAKSNNMDLLAPILMGAQGMRKNIPKAIASMTGGEYELFKSGKNFDTRMNDFDNHLYNRYLLSFQPSDPHPGLHHVRVSLQHSAHSTVLARDSYWVSPPLRSKGLGRER